AKSRLWPISPSRGGGCGRFRLDFRPQHRPRKRPATEIDHNFDLAEPRRSSQIRAAKRARWPTLRPAPLRTAKALTQARKTGSSEFVVGQASAGEEHSESVV